MIIKYDIVEDLVIDVKIDAAGITSEYKIPFKFGRNNSDITFLDSCKTLGWATSKVAGMVFEKEKLYYHTNSYKWNSKKLEGAIKCIDGRKIKFFVSEVNPFDKSLIKKYGIEIQITSGCYVATSSYFCVSGFAPTEKGAYIAVLHLIRAELLHQANKVEKELRF